MQNEITLAEAHLIAKTEIMFTMADMLDLSNTVADVDTNENAITIAKDSLNAFMATKLEELEKELHKCKHYYHARKIAVKYAAIAHYSGLENSNLLFNVDYKILTLDQLNQVLDAF
jgi:D-mannonate dehydratase